MELKIKDIEGFKKFYEETMDLEFLDFAETIGFGVANNYIAYSVALSMTMKHQDCNKDYAKGCIDSWMSIFGGYGE